MDKEFFAREIEASADMLYRVAWTILHDGDACRDALQDMALKAWDKRHTLHHEAYFRTWLTRILIHTCYDMQKKRGRCVFLDDMPEPSVPPPDPVLGLALQSLPEKLRLPLVLYYAEGMTYAEIAQAMTLPISTVRGRIHRAKEALRKELEAE